MFNSPFFTIGSIPAPFAPMSINFSTSFFYTPTAAGDTPFSTDFYYNPNIE